ncbi:MAG: EAL domain-containing protein [Burkholderiaceae bacterium]|nr:EAL domain-containing protein [Burkholderiaceae bacterium]
MRQQPHADKKPAISRATLLFVIFSLSWIIAFSIAVAEADDHHHLHVLIVGSLSYLLFAAGYFIYYRIQEIADRKRDDERIYRLNQFYAARCFCSRVMASSRSPDEMFRKICHAIVEYADMTVAWVGWLNPHDDAVYPISSYSRFPNIVELLQLLKLSVDETAPGGKGAVATALREHHPVWTPDIGKILYEEQPDSWKTAITSLNIRSIAALPLKQNNILYGALCVYSDVPNAFDNSVQDLMTDLVSDIDFALGHFVHEEQLQLSAQIIEQSSEGLILLDNSGRIVMVNAAFTMITGYGFDEVRGKPPDILSSGIHEKDFYTAMWNSVNEGDMWQGEVFNRRKDTSIHPVWLSIKAMRDDNGILTHYIIRFTDVTKHKEVEEKAQWFSHFDALTGLPNRILLRERCRMALSMVQRKSESLGMMLIDLDNFRNVNDSLGHDMGDHLLKQFANRLRNVVREQDTVARIGGDEFVLLLPGADTDAAAFLAERLISVAAQSYTIDGNEISLTTSIGIALYPCDGTDFDMLLRNADTAMYRAKESGRNDYCFFTEEMQTRSTRRLQLDSAMRRALERNQFTVYYQPKMSLKDDRIVGFEALLRWNHPELGPISPVEFIPIAENNSEILIIGEWVMRTAARQIREWLDKGFANLSVAVNLSVVQFRHPRLVEVILDIQDEFKLPPECLHVELTEGVAMTNTMAAITVMDELNRHGLCISIDDFGTGYSSLAYLKRFSVYSLKIDRSFVKDIPADADDMAIIDAVISLAQSLGMVTIAEGVETEEQLAFLRERGCAEIQGYLLSRPIPAENIPAFLVEHELKRNLSY